MMPDAEFIRLLVAVRLVYMQREKANFGRIRGLLYKHGDETVRRRAARMNTFGQARYMGTTTSSSSRVRAEHGDPRPTEARRARTTASADKACLSEYSAPGTSRRNGGLHYTNAGSKNGTLLSSAGSSP